MRNGTVSPTPLSEGATARYLHHVNVHAHPHNEQTLSFEPDTPARPRWRHATRVAAARRWAALALSWLRRNKLTALLLTIGLTLACVFAIAAIKSIIGAFHWAEAHVDRTSPLHMAIFLVFGIVAFIPLPIPIVLQAWALAIGCFFRWRAFPILVVSMTVGINMAFLIGRRLAGSDAVGGALSRHFPTGLEHMRSLRKAVARRPLRLSFLLMWLPLPTAFCPFLVGFMVPPAELPLRTFALGAVPSKLLHFTLDVLIGLEAGSFAEALNHHGEMHEMHGGAQRHKWASVISAATLVLALVFMGGAGVYVHQALSELKAKEEQEVERDASPGAWV